LTYLGYHTKAVQRGINLGVLLFIISEALFFLSIFWAFFHSSLTPSVELGCAWPPAGIEPVNPYELPMLNTVLLLSSGSTITYSHHSHIKGTREDMLLGLTATVLLALIFTGLDQPPRMLFGDADHTKLSINNYYSSTASLHTVAENTGSGLRSTSKGLRFFKNQTPKWDTNRFYTTSVKDLNVKETELSPNWISGFADAESTFLLKIYRGSTSQSGWNVIPEFKIELHTRDMVLLRKKIMAEHYSIGVGRTFKNFSAKEAKRFYTTAIKDNNVKEPKLSPYWVTGFSDAESCFFLNVHKKSSNKIGWGVQPEFSINLHMKDLILLRELHLFFGVGSIYVQEAKNMASYRVASLRDITNVIIPHFDKYPLITQKKADFILFKQGVNLLNFKAHREIEGLRQILGLKASMNRQVQSEKLILNFPGILPHPRPIVSFDKSLHPDWFTGFVDGEGCFYVKITKNKKTEHGVNLSMEFSISQHVRDELLLTKFIEYLGCGTVYKFSTRPNSVSFTVSKFKYISEKVIPFFQKYPLQGIKALDFKCFCEIWKIVESKGHLSDEGLKKVKSLKSGMNNNRELN
jgi:hypothetical protein